MPARRVAVVDPGSQRLKLLLAELHGSHVRVTDRRLVDRHEETGGDEAAAADWISPWLAEAAPDALVLVLPQAQAFHRVLETPATGPAGVAGLLAEEAARIEGLTGVRMASDAVRLAPHAGHSAPLGTTFWREQATQEWTDAHGGAEVPPLNLVPGAAALAAAHLAQPGAAREAVLVDLGARQTTVAVLQGGQLVHALAIPEGSRLWTEAIAADRGCGAGSAEVLKRSEDLFAGGVAERLGAALSDWVQDIEQALADWAADLPARGALDPARWPVFLTGGGGAQPGLLGHLRARSTLDWRPWPGDEAEAAFAPALGALARTLGEPPSAPSALPAEARGRWRRERLWRGVLALNLLLLATLAVALGVSTLAHARQHAAREAWLVEARAGIASAQAARSTAEEINRQFAVWRPLLARQRQSVESVEALATLRRERTNDTFWYVLVGDLESYERGTAALLPPTNRAAEVLGPRLGPPPPPGLPGARALVAEVGLLPQGEEMRQTLSDLVGRLRASPPFRNVDVLPPEARRQLVATNLAYPDRFFALELSLSESDLLSPLPVLPRRATNGPARSGPRPFLAPRAALP